MNSDLTIRSLNWKQPYGEAMLLGKIETRTWHTNYRGWVLMCSSKEPYSINQIKNISGTKLSEKLLVDTNFINHTELDINIFGRAFAIGYLSDCYKMQKSDEEKTYVQFNADLYCHVYKEVHPILAFERKGSQKWGHVSDIDKNKIRIIKSDKSTGCRIYSSPFTLNMMKTIQMLIQKHQQLKLDI